VHMGCGGIIYPLLYMEVDGVSVSVSVSVHRHPSATLPPRKEPALPLKQEAGRTPNRFGRCGDAMSLVCVWSRTTIRWPSSQFLSHCTDYTT
jgi:hypothetical protein